jgi:hypothetical protein
MLSLSLVVGRMASSFLSRPIELDQDIPVTHDGGTCIFPRGTVLPAVHDLGSEDSVLFLGSDFQHVIVKVPQVIRHKSSPFAPALCDFLVTKDGVLQLEDNSTFPMEVEMPSGQMLLMVNKNMIIAIKNATNQLSPPAPLSASTPLHSNSLNGSILLEVDSEEAVNVELSSVPTSDSISIVGLPIPAATALSSHQPTNSSVSFNSPIQLKHCSIVSAKGPSNWLIPAWLKHFEENYDELFLVTLSPQIQGYLARDEKFKFSKWNCSILDDLLDLAYKLSGNHRPSARECDHLAAILAQKHPRNYGSVDIAVDEDREQVLAGDKGTGGLQGNVNLGNRLHKRFYEVFMRKKNARSRAKDPDPLETVQKKTKSGGRPKVIHGMDYHKMYPQLTEEEKLEKADLLKGAEDQDFEERVKVYKFEAGGSLIQHELISSSVSSAKEVAPAFFQLPIHLENLFFTVSHSNNIFEKSRRHMKFEMRVLEEFLLDELPSGGKTSLIEAIRLHSKNDNSSKHAFCMLRSLADLWEQNFDQLIFVSEKDDACLKDNPEPHLVAPLGDLTNLSLYVDHTKIMDCLDFPTGLAALIAIHFLAHLEYGKGCMLLKQYLQREVLELGLKFIMPRGQKMELRKLNFFQTKKRDIVKQMHRVNVTDRPLI